LQPRPDQKATGRFNWPDGSSGGAGQGEILRSATGCDGRPLDGGRMLRGQTRRVQGTSNGREWRVVQKTALTGRGDRNKADTAHSHTGLLCVRKGTRGGHRATITATREVDADEHRHSGPWNADRGAGAQIQRLAAAEHHRDATTGASSHVEAARRAQVNMGQSIVSRSRPTAKQTN
jgi:hypothetical protein